MKSLPRDVVAFASPSDMAMEEQVAERRLDFQPCSLTEEELQERLQKNRTFIPHSCLGHWDAPILWSFPGSGNTWTRDLLEISTGYHTGSVYNDAALYELYPGEYTCDASTLVVKAHATLTPYELVSNWAKEPELQEDEIPWHGEEVGVWLRKEAMIHRYFRKCKQWTPSRAIVIDREPFGAIWAEYQRYVVGEHTSIISRDLFDRQHFNSEALRLAQGYLASWSSYELFRRSSNATDPLLVIPFQELVQDCPGSMQKVMTWLQPPRQPDGGPWKVDKACSHKQEKIKRDKSKSVPLEQVWTPDLVCRVWSIVGGVCAEHGHKSTPPGLEIEINCPLRDQVAAALAPRVAYHRTVVLVATSSQDAAATMNWMLHARKHQEERARTMDLLIAAADWESYDLFNSMGAAVVPIIPRYSPAGRKRREGDKRFDGILLEKHELVKSLLLEGFDVLSCDVDTIWRTDVLSKLHKLTFKDATDSRFLREHSKVRIVAAPASVAGGIVDMSGLVFFRGGAETAHLVHSFQTEYAEGLDLQAAWKAVLTHAGAHQAARGRVDLKTQLADAGTISVHFWSEPQFQRDCTDGLNERALAVRCRNDAEELAASLRQYGLWMCPVDWQNMMRTEGLPGSEGANKDGASDSLPAPASPPMLLDRSPPDLTRFERRLDGLVKVATLRASIILFIEGEESQFLDMMSLASNIADGARSHNMRLELIVVAWGAPDEWAKSLLALARNASTHLQVRFLSVPTVLQTLALRRHVGSSTGLARAVAYNMGARLASAQHMVTVALNALFTSSFYAKLQQIHRMPYEVQIVTACVTTAASSVSLRGHEETHKGCALASGHVGVLTPVALWAEVGGMPESPVLAEHSDRYFDLRLRAAQQQVELMQCGSGACAIAAQGRLGNAWRVGPAQVAQIAPGAARKGFQATLPVQAIDQELALIQRSMASRGLDSSCRWGMVGQRLVELSQPAGELEQTEIVVPDVSVGVDENNAGTLNDVNCGSSIEFQRKAWIRWRTRAHNGKPLLVVKVEGGLGNRLRSFAGGWALAAELNMQYVGIWEPDVECSATFYDLFDPIEDLLVLNFVPWGDGDVPPGWLEFDGVATGKRVVLNKLQSEGKNVYIRTQQFPLSNLYRYSVDSFARKLHQLLPRKSDLAKILDHVAQQIGATFSMGMHVRMVGNESAYVFGVEKQLEGVAKVELSGLAWTSEDAKKGLQSRRDACHWNNFITPARALFNRLSAQIPVPDGQYWKVMVACDAASCIEGVRKALGQDISVVSLHDFIPQSWFDDCERDSRSVLCQRLALLEVELLSKAHSILISAPSSFSDAIRFKNVGRLLEESDDDKARGKPDKTSRAKWRRRAGVVCGTSTNFTNTFAPKQSAWLYGEINVNMLV